MAEQEIAEPAAPGQMEVEIALDVFSGQLDTGIDALEAAHTALAFLWSITAPHQANEDDPVRDGRLLAEAALGLVTGIKEGQSVTSRAALLESLASEYLAALPDQKP